MPAEGDEKFELKEWDIMFPAPVEKDIYGYKAKIKLLSWEELAPVLISIKAILRAIAAIGDVRTREDVAARLTSEDAGTALGAVLEVAYTELIKIASLGSGVPEPVLQKAPGRLVPGIVLATIEENKDLREGFQKLGRLLPKRKTAEQAVLANATVADTDPAI